MALKKSDPVLRRIIDEIAQKHDLKHSTVTTIISEQFTYVNKIIARGEFEVVRMPYLGKFAPSAWKIQAVTQGALRKAKEKYDHDRALHAGQSDAGAEQGVTNTEGVS